VVKEDISPGPEKIREVPDGYMILNISGVRLQVTARIDRTGYDVTRRKSFTMPSLFVTESLSASVGQHRIFTGQKVYVNDPTIAALYRPAAGDPTAKTDIHPKNAIPDIRLVFSLAPHIPAHSGVGNTDPDSLFLASNKPGPDMLGSQPGGGTADKEAQEPGKPQPKMLFINGLALRNTIMVF
jgi:hypothetical protein